VTRYQVVAQRFLKACRDSVPPTTPIDEARFVVLDCELTGLDPLRAQLVSVGAVAVLAGEIVLSDSFDQLVRISHNTSAVTVHGVTREQSQAGRRVEDVFEDLLDYLGPAVIVGHHIAFDLAALNGVGEKLFDLRLPNPSIDTMRLAIALERAGALEAEPNSDFSLDGLLRRFGIEPHDRHTAAGDAFLTAQVFQRLLARAQRLGRSTLGELLELDQSAAEPEDA
jgi:DNA polymerase III subunit epsilon